MLLAMMMASTLNAAEPMFCSDNRHFCVSYRLIENPSAWSVEIGERQPDGRYEVTRSFVTQRYPHTPLISDDGRYVVFLRRLDRDENLTILRGDGTIAAEPAISGLVSEHDLAYVPWRSERWSIRSETLVLSIPATLDEKPEAKRGEIEIDLESGRLLTPMRDIYPQWRVFAHAEDGSIAQQWLAPRCTPGARLGFHSRGLLPVDSQTFYANRLVRPLPVVPDLVRKARIAGRVHVEAIVDADGAVTCARASFLPFGADAAVENVVLGWRFRPFTLKGKPVPAIGSFIIEFRQVDNDVWKRLAAEQ